MLFGLVSAVQSESFDTIRPLKDDELYRRNKKELVPRDNDPILLVTDSGVVIFYEKYGILNVYDFDGVFQYGLQIITSPNGIGKIGYSQGYVFVKSRASYMFVFNNDQMITNVKFSDDQTTYRTLEQFVMGEPNHQNSEMNYAITGNGVIRYSEHSPIEKLISLPQKNSEVELLIIYFLVVVTGVMIYSSRIYHHTE